MLDPELTKLADKIIQLCVEKKLKISTAESCTGGLVAACLTSVAGSSLVFERGYITYANAAKVEEIGVPPALLSAHGAVSEEVAKAMAKGARQKAGADVAIAITGIAGPGGGSPEKPVGLVYIGLCTARECEAKRFLFEGDRADIRRQTVTKALAWLLATGKEL